MSLGCQACKTQPVALEGATPPAESTEQFEGPEPNSWAPDIRERADASQMSEPVQISTGTGTSLRTLDGLGEAEILDLNHALWGEDIPNSVKGISPAWDPGEGLLYSSAIMGPYLMISKPDASHPHQAIDLRIEGSHTNRMAVDSQRRRLFWVAGPTEQIRVVDLEQKTLIAAYDPSESFKGYPVQDIAVDPSTGWLWVVNTSVKRVKGYSADLKESTEISGLSGPVALSADPDGDGLYIIDTASKQEARLVHYQPSSGKLSEVKDLAGRGRPPRYVAALSGGRAVVAGRELIALSRSGAELWRTRLSHAPVAVKAGGDVVVTLLSSSEAPAKARSHPDFVPDPLDQVVVHSASTGSQKAKATLRYESRRLTIDAAGRRAFIGNGGDGSVSIVGLDRAGEPRLIDVANAAEGTVADPRSGRRFVLNRLGGSEIYAWDSQGLARFATLPWPFELAIDPVRRQLIAVSYYEAKAYRWDIDSSEPMPTIDLGIPEGTGDTLGDISYDPSTGNLAVVLPQEGWVALANLDSGQSTWTAQLSHMQIGDHGGPGRGLVAIGDGVVHVVGGKPLTATNLSLSSGIVTQETSLSTGRGGSRSAYRLNTLYHDSSGGRLFSGGMVIDPDTLRVEKTLARVDKVFYADSTQILAMDVDQNTEYLLRLDPSSLAERDRWAVTDTEVIRTEASFEPETRHVLFSDLPRAEVMVVELP
jgi:hypothetical protein